MSELYRSTRATKIVNAIFALATRIGIGARFRYLLKVRGRSTGINHVLPVDVMDVDGVLFLVSPYGEVNWVKNLRVAGDATLRRGRRETRYEAVEVSGTVAIPVIRKYVARVPVTRRYWDVTSGSTDDEILTESRRHPVFRLQARSAR
jgi:deazaflavin-dependent oxidoreductase (nitroreductase family)